MYQKKQWCGFTGGRDPGEELIVSASREAWEESMGIFGTQEEIQKKIETAPYAIYSSNGRKSSFQYLIRYNAKDFSQLQANFNNVTNYLKHCDILKTKVKSGCYEKTQGRWFLLSDVIKAATYNLPIIAPDHYLRDLFDMSLIDGDFVKNPSGKTFS